MTGVVISVREQEHKLCLAGSVRALNSQSIKPQQTEEARAVKVFPRSTREHSSQRTVHASTEGIHNLASYPV